MTYPDEIHPLVGTRPIIAAAAVVFIADRQGNLLLLREKTGGPWHLPIGWMEPGETLETAAQRSILDLLSITVDDLWLVNVFSGPQLARGKPGSEVFPITAAYLPRSVKGTLRANPRLAELRFFATWNLRLDEVYPPDQPIVMHFIQRFPGGRPQSLEDMPGYHNKYFWEDLSR